MKPTARTILLVSIVAVIAPAGSRTQAVHQRSGAAAQAQRRSNAWPARTVARQGAPQTRAAAARRPGLVVDGGSISLGGRQEYLWTAELPYYRLSPAQWQERLEAARAVGIRVITAYIPWNLHEAREGQFDFDGEQGDGRTNLIGFLELIDRLGMYFIAKPGPFICAEVRHGGIPDWLTSRHPEIVMKDQRGRAVRFRQDRTPLPDYLNPTYLAYVRRWYTRLYDGVLRRYQYGRGPIVAVQVENELMYSTSELADPFSWGYTDVVRAFYRQWLAAAYGDIAHYDRRHATDHAGYEEILPPRSGDWPPSTAAEWLVFQDWVRFKEWYGAEVLGEYAGILRTLGVTVPLYHNAGMLEDEAPVAFGPLSRRIWLGVNFWLDPPPLDNLSSYVRGIRRLKQLRGSQPNRPAVATEVNWGWGGAAGYDFLTRSILPYSKAANIYPLADSASAGRLDGRRYSNSREPYPGAAPIDVNGAPRPAYWLLDRLTRFTGSEGAQLAQAEPIADIALGSYRPYNYLGLYTRFTHTDPRALTGIFDSTIGANEFLQDLMTGFVEADIEFGVLDLREATIAEMSSKRMLIVLSQERMDAATQRRLVEYVRRGGTLVLLPTIPTRDLEGERATVLKDALVPDLSLGPARSADGRERLWWEGHTTVAAAQRVVHILDGAARVYRVLARDQTGNVVAVEKAVEGGKLILIGTYVTDPGVYLRLAREQGLVASFASCPDPDVEAVPLASRATREIYLFVINRAPFHRQADVSYVDVFSRDQRRTVRVSISGRSVSILKEKEGTLVSATLNGDAVEAEGGAMLRLDRGSEADLLRNDDGILFRSDRRTAVVLRLPETRAAKAVRVYDSAGGVVPSALREGILSFVYDPQGRPASYYRLVFAKSKDPAGEETRATVGRGARRGTFGRPRGRAGAGEGLSRLGPS